MVAARATPAAPGDQPDEGGRISLYPALRPDADRQRQQRLAPGVTLVQAQTAAGRR